MSIKYKHCCLLNEFDTLEVDARVIKTDIVGNNESALCFMMYNEKDNFKGSVYLDKKTAIRFAKSIRTEINKIQ